MHYRIYFNTHWLQRLTSNQIQFKCGQKPFVPVNHLLSPLISSHITTVRFDIYRNRVYITCNNA